MVDVSFGDKLAVLFSNLFFLGGILTDSLEHMALYNKLKESSNDKKFLVDALKENNASHFFNDVLLLSLLNGFSIIITMNQIEIGAGLMILGVLFSNIGKNISSYLMTDRNNTRAQSMYNWAFHLLTGYSTGFIGYWFFNQQLIGFIGAFGLGFSIATILVYIQPKINVPET